MAFWGGDATPPVLLRRAQVVTQAMRDLAVDPDRFVAIRDQLLREYRNKLLKPIKLAGYER